MILRPAAAAAAATALLLLASCAHQPQAEPQAAKPALVVNVATAADAPTVASRQALEDESSDSADDARDEQPRSDVEDPESPSDDEIAEHSGVLDLLGQAPTGSGGLGLTGIGRSGGATGSGFGRGGGRLGRSGAGTSVVAPTAPAVKGSLPKDLIRRVIRQKLSQIRFCYERQLRQDPKLEGKLVVKFVIARDGSVSTASIAESLDPTVDTCVQRSFMGMRFPKPNGGIVIVSYPLQFRTGDGT